MKTRKKTNRFYAKVLYDLIADVPANKQDEAIQVFVQFLYKEHKIRNAEKIIAEFEKYSGEKEGKIQIEIESARDLSKTEIDKIKKMFGDNVAVATKINPDLIGGVIIRADDKLYDASVKTQLTLMKKNLVY